MADFESYLREAIGEDRARTALAALSDTASVSVRLNPSKPFDFSRHFPATKPVPWSPHGLLLSQRPSFTFDPLFHSGAYYVQDSSAMFVGEIFRQIIKDKPKCLKVLDLCAAPGGKTSDLAASLRAHCSDNFLLVANEVMRARASVLCSNVAVWGDPSVLVTSVDPKAFAKLEGFFDIIVADVPCSGEGMFRKDEEALRQWSEDNVKLCESRQRRILADVWPALAPGGELLYSTCTFNRRENDLNVKWAAAEFAAGIVKTDISAAGPIETECGWSLVPGFVPGEGQYCAVLRKSDFGYTRTSARTVKAIKEAVPPIPADLFDRPVSLKLRSDIIVALPQEMSHMAEAIEFLRPLHSGLAVGRVKGKDFVPHADLALTTMLRDGGVYPKVSVDLKTARQYLQRSTLVLSDAPRGYLLLCYEGMPMGFVKNIGGRCNNLYPPNRIIRKMNYD